MPETFTQLKHRHLQAKYGVPYFQRLFEVAHLLGRYVLEYRAPGWDCDFEMAAAFWTAFQYNESYLAYYLREDETAWISSGVIAYVGVVTFPPADLPVIEDLMRRWPMMEYRWLMKEGELVSELSIDEVTR